MKFKFKKSLGQNFLVDKNILEKISNVGNIKKNNEILEIGPGTGNLTEYLIKKNPKKIYLIEKDRSLCEVLRDKFGNKAIIFNNDFLNFSKFKNFGDDLIIFGNLPYNVSSQILTKLIINDEKIKFQKIIFMFQKELADRILSKENSRDFGRISILANWKFKIEKVFDISPNSFQPRPKIQSSLLIFTPKIKFLKFKNPKNLEYVTRVFFNQRRKKIKKPFNILFKNKEYLIKKLKLDLNLRPQNISIETFFNITKEYEESIN